MTIVVVLTSKARKRREKTAPQNHKKYLRMLVGTLVSELWRAQASQYRNLKMCVANSNRNVQCGAPDL